jgi:UDP-glucose 4-epimerase
MLLPVPNALAPKGRAAGGWERDRIVVIGCGFIGTKVVLELVARGLPPIVLTRSKPHGDVVDAIAPEDLVLGDITESGELATALRRARDVIYTAGGLLPAASEEQPGRDAELTLAPLRAVLGAMREQPGVRLSYVSSGGTVYGQPERLPVDETAPTNPVGSYGRLHLSCEQEIERHRAEHGLTARILRCSTVYGEYQLPDRGQGAVTTFLHRIDRGLPIKLYGGGETIRDYMYGGDVAKVLADLLDRKGGPPVLNVGSGEGTSLRELLQAAETQTGKAAVVEELGERDFDVHRIVLDTTRLREMIAFEPTPLATGMARTLAWLRGAVNTSLESAR